MVFEIHCRSKQLQNVHYLIPAYIADKAIQEG